MRFAIKSMCHTAFFACAVLGCAAELEGGAEIHAALTLDPAVVISQVYGGGGNNTAPYQHDFVELFNRSSAGVALGGMSLQYASATGSGNFGASAASLLTFPSAAVLAPGRYYLVQLAGNQAIGAPLPTPDLPDQSMAVSSSAGKLALVTGTTSLGCNGGSVACTTQADRIVDLIGFGTANYFEGAAAPALGNSSAAIRKGAGCIDSNDNAADFDVQAPAPRNGATPAAVCGNAGDAAPRVTATVPADAARNVSPNAALQISFSEDVAAAASWFTFDCNMSGAIAAVVSGGPNLFTLTPPSALANGEVCSVSVRASEITDVDSMDPPDLMLADYTFSFSVAGSLTPLAVHSVQGAAHVSPYSGQSANVGPAIVTLLRNNGFYMQDPEPDADTATSEGILVFTGSAPSVAVGDRVMVLGTVVEYRPGCMPSCGASTAEFDNLTTTEITEPVISVIDSGNPLPGLVLLGQAADQRSVPLQVICDDSVSSVETSGSFDPSADGIDFYESLEGMRVQIDSPAVIDPTRTFPNRAPEIGVLARADAGLRTPRGGIIYTEGDPNPERLFLSSTLLGSFPTVQIGDAFAGAVIGVVDYSFANYKLLVSEVLPPVISAGLSQETTALVASSPSQLSIASMNVENLDALDTPAKFSELAAIVVESLRSPDLIALEEVQDNTGPKNDAVVDASLTLSTFIGAIASAGGPSYTYRQIDPVNNTDGGQTGGNIRVVFLFRTDRGLVFVDRGSATASTANSVDDASGAPQLAFSPGRIEPDSAAFNASRKPLAGEFTFHGSTLFVIANHFNSKGGDDPLFGRIQPPVLSSETQRLQQAALVAGFVDAILEADSGAYVVALGDFNDFSFSPALETLQQVGLVDLIHTLPANERYTYVYEGNSQDLDHILVSPSLAARSSYDVVHVNAEFAAQASDHEPAVMLIELGDAPVISTRAAPAALAVGEQLSFQVSASGSPAPSFALVSGPSGMTVDALTGLVSWTANAAAREVAFTIQASNAVGSATKEFSVRVTGAQPGLPPPAAGWEWLARLRCVLLPRLCPRG